VKRPRRNQACLHAPGLDPPCLESGLSLLGHERSALTLDFAPMGAQDTPVPLPAFLLPAVGEQLLQRLADQLRAACPLLPARPPDSGLSQAI